jgi:aspartate racemase
MMIGVVAGAGPFAGLDLLGKILAQTQATRDQEHLTVLSLSLPEAIADRTAFLLGETAVNPAYAIAAQFAQLAQAGASVAAIPCNTAHAPPIFDVVRAELARQAVTLRLLHMIQAVGGFLQAHFPHVRRVGVLSTTGTAVARIYPLHLEPLGYTVLTPPPGVQQGHVHRAIYDPDYGIKACGVATDRARADALAGARWLQEAGAELLVLGCTELPLAIPEATLGPTPIVDATLVLARALIQAVAPQKLRPWRLRS